MGDSKATAFGKHFITNFAPEILRSYLLQIQLYMSRKVWLSDRCVYLIVDFLEEWCSLPCKKRSLTLQHQAESDVELVEE